MCGIAGIFDRRGTLREQQRQSLVRMSNTMKRRGPDAEGEWMNSTGSVAFVHRRLSIIDPDSRANQPMRSGCERYTVTFNGEIYNFLALRKELESLGHQFATRSDTEVILAAYAQWGKHCFARLRGMFAIAIWDDRTHALVLARDPMGIKPLYVSANDSEVRFASQVKTLVAGGAGRETSNAGIVGFLMLGSFPEPHTSYRDIQMLRAGEVRTITQDQEFSEFNQAWLEAWQYESELNDEVVHSAVRDSVDAHLTSDVPVGLFLSSGIDSCAVASIACRNQEASMKAVTLRFEDFHGTQEDEGPLAARIASELGLEFYESRVTDDDLSRCLPAIMDDMDQPSIDGFNTWFISRIAAEQGLKVVLSGVGGDELFGGYPSFSRIPKWLRQSNTLARVPGARLLTKPLVETAISLGLVNAKAKMLLQPDLDVETCWLAQRSIFRADEISSLIGRERFEDGIKQLDLESEIERALTPKPLGEALQISVLESRFYLRHQLLRDADWASMAHSLELRTPLVDQDLYASVGPRLRDRSATGYNKDALAASPITPLPEYVAKRPKTGFVVPMERWLDQFDILSGWKRASAKETDNWHWARKLALSVVDPECVGAGGQI